jgi:hypothetical protein
MHFCHDKSSDKSKGIPFIVTWNKKLAHDDTDISTKNFSKEILENAVKLTSDLYPELVAVQSEPKNRIIQII